MLWYFVADVTSQVLLGRKSLALSAAAADASARRGGQAIALAWAAQKATKTTGVVGGTGDFASNCAYASMSAVTLISSFYSR